jgi:hypothetical protein
MGGFSLETLENLLKEEEPPSRLKDLRDKYWIEQTGPLIQYDREMRCASRGCGSSTFFKLQGIPKCTTHCLKTMNEMLQELGVEE